MKAAIYCRVSTDNQEREGTSLQTQMEACFTYCQEKDYEVSYRFSEAYSGLSLERPELDKLRELVRTDNIGVVVCYSLDRLTRDPGHGVIITQEFEKHGVTLDAVTEDVDNTELGKLISYIRGYASKLEAEKIRERTMRGKRAHLAMGQLPQGTGIGVYGYNWNKETKKREVHEFEAKIVQDIFHRVASGESLISIARVLNQNHVPSKGKKLWHSLTIRRMVKNKSYIGQTYFNGTLLPDVSPAIVDKDIFQIANEQLNKPKVRTGRPKNEYLLRNHAFCAICGKPLVGHILNKKYRYYQCSNARPYENTKKLCSARYIRAEALEKTVWEKTQAILSQPEIILKELTKECDMGSLATIEADVKALQKKLKGYEKRRDNLLQAIEWDEFTQDEILDRLNNLKSQRLEDEKKLDEFLQIKNNLSSLATAQVKFSNFYSQILEHLDNASLEIKRLALDALDIKVYASTDDVEIKGAIPLELASPTTERTLA